MSEVDLGFTSKDTAGAYGVGLTVIVNGTAAPAKTAAIVVGSPKQRASATFSFSPALSITPGSTVRLVAKVISGPGELSYEGQTDSSCPVIVVDGDVGTAQIVGPKIPVRVVGTFQ